VAGLISLRGQVITVFDLRRLLTLGAAPAGEPTRILVVRERDGEEATGLIVDEVTRVWRLASTDVEEIAHPGEDGLWGVAHIGQERIGLIDLFQILSRIGLG